MKRNFRKRVVRESLNVGKQTKVSNLLVVAAIFVIILAIGFLCIADNELEEQEVLVDQIINEPIADNIENTVTSIDPADKFNFSVTEIPTSALIEMSFSPQAPYANWDQPWQDACEEASIIMVKYYLDQKPLSNDIMNQEILKMVPWQEENFGGHLDLPSEKTLELAVKFYTLDGQIDNNLGVENIKKYIANGVPVIIPVDGKKLNNPNYTNGGPDYHMLVIKGYTETEFITNDPGTRKGEGYTYSFQTVIDSIKNPEGGERTMLVLKKQ